MSGGSIALVTPSYAADFERCRLLCDSMDAFVSGHSHHYILVADHDADMFAALAGSKRTIVAESDILPSWLHPVPGGLRASSRKMWLSFRTLPMRGWHVQQLRRMAIANHVGDDGLLYCDSDMLFVKPFDTGSLWRQDALRLYKITNGITPDMSEHKTWCNVAAQLLGQPAPQFPADDFINNLVSWRRKTVLELCETIENHTGLHWIAAIGRNRTFSECQIYGAHICRSANAENDHWIGEDALCQTYWNGKALDAGSLADFVALAEPGQVAIGIQSFTNTDTKLLRRLFEKAA